MVLRCTPSRPSLVPQKSHAFRSLPCPPIGPGPYSIAISERVPCGGILGAREKGARRFGGAAEERVQIKGSRTPYDDQIGVIALQALSARHVFSAMLSRRLAVSPNHAKGVDARWSSRLSRR